MLLTSLFRGGGREKESSRSIPLMNCISVSSIDVHSGKDLARNSLTLRARESSTAELDPNRFLSKMSLNFDDSVKSSSAFALLSPHPAYALAKRCKFIETSAFNCSFRCFFTVQSNSCRFEWQRGGAEGEPCRCVVGFISYKGREEEEGKERLCRWESYIKQPFL